MKYRQTTAIYLFPKPGSQLNSLEPFGWTRVIDWSNLEPTSNLN